MSRQHEHDWQYEHDDKNGINAMFMKKRCSCGKQYVITIPDAWWVDVSVSKPPRVPTRSDNPTLVVMRFDSYCANCGNPCDPKEKTHETNLGYDESIRKMPGCGIEYKYIGSMYMGMKADLVALRPDLEYTENFRQLQKPPKRHDKTAGPQN